MQIHIPCPPGWGYPPRDTVKLARLAIETGEFVLFEIENGKFRFTGRSKSLAEKGNRLPLINYIERQERFKKMSVEQLSRLQKFIDSKWNEYVKKAEA
jgi:pyruvate ferredoxin oxidoreductase beta subunit